jgi:hypothetical protein
MPAAFDFTAAGPELWVPTAFGPDALTNLGGRFVEVVARLRPGVSLAAAQAEANAIARGLLSARPPDAQDEGRTVRLLAYGDDLAGDVRAQLLVLLGAVGLVLLIACVNVANLLAARGVARGRELAIRAALGAGRGRIVRQLVAESALLAALGTAAGLALAYGGVALLVRFVPAGCRAWSRPPVDARVLAFAVGLAVLTALLLSVLPARQSDRGDLLGALQRGGRTTRGAVRGGARAALVTGEVALALVLLVGAGLLVRSALHLRAVPAASTARRCSPRACGCPPRATASRARGRDLPAPRRRGRRGAGHALGGGGLARAAHRDEHRAWGSCARATRRRSRPTAGVSSNFRLVSAGYFATMGIPLRWGRDFGDATRPRRRARWW